MLYFIYELTDLRDGLPLYVGITDNPNRRYREHLASNDKNYGKQVWIQELGESSLKPKMGILEVVESLEEAREREKYWIAHYLEQGVSLTNIQYNRQAPCTEDSHTEENEQDAYPLTERQVLIWRIGYGDANSLPIKHAKVTVGQLYRLFETNDLLDNISGSSLIERVAFLKAMLHVTPRVKFIKQTRQFLYQPEKSVSVFLLRDLQDTILPSDIS